MSDELYREARRLAGEGIPSLPCGKDKRPLTEHGFYDATTLDVMHDEWFNYEQAPSIAVPTGDPHFVLDIDPAQGGQESLDDWVSQHGVLPHTVTVKSGGGGTHYYFNQPPDVVVPNTASLLAPGIDTRGQGGYAIVPPSGHKNGGQYTYLSEPLTINRIKDPPEWLVQRIKACLGKRAVGHTPIAASRIQEGLRNDTLYRFGCSMRANGAGDYAIRIALEAINTDQCSPALDQKELNRVIASILKHEPGAFHDGADWVLNPIPRLHGAAPAFSAENLFISFDEVGEATQEWVLKPYLPKGTLNLLEGDNDTGKSLLSLKFAALVTTGGIVEPLCRNTGLFESTDGRVAKGNVLYFTREDSLETAKKRFIKMNGDLSRLFTVRPPSPDMPYVDFGLASLDILKAGFEKYKPVLVIFDVMTSFLSINTDKSYEVRRVLTPLWALAQAHGVTILLIRHLSKALQLHSGYRGSGSQEFSNAARSILRVGKIPGDKSGMKALTHLKHNLSAAGPSFTYTTGKDEVTFGNIVELTPSDLDISARRTAGYVPVEEAVEFIIGEITHGAIPVADLDGKAEAMGFTANSITNAKRKLKAENRIEVFPDNSGSRGSSGWFIGPPGQKNGTIGSTRRRRRSKWSDINLTFHSYPIGPRVEQTIDL